MDDKVNDDGLKWFGEGFDGFPKRLPEDCVEYFIHVLDEQFKNPTKNRARLDAILKHSTELKKSLLKDYIWQREEFALRLHTQLAPQPKDVETRPHLRGRTNFGDSVVDEWLIVYLLKELSRQFPDAWIRVCDTDGEFLLIEAAGALPKWLNPDIAENRVWISNDHLRIIPLGKDENAQKLTLHDALAFIEQQSDKLLISPYIEDEAFYRLRDYPSSIQSSLHNAVVTIPRSLAALLHRNPAYVSPAIEAFYLRDSVSLRPLTSKDLSTLKFAPEDFVTVSTRFTKVGYAQLRSQIFEPPPSWTAVIPRMTDSKVEMGMKLTCGFEILLQDTQNQDKRSVREMKLLLDDIEKGKENLPSNSDISSWPQTQDDEKWLDIDYNDFESEISGKERSKNEVKTSGFGDAGAQASLRKMVSRFEDFLNDDTTGAGGVDDFDNDDESDSASDSGEDKDGSFSEAEFERAMKEMMGMPPDEIEKSGLLDEARRLAVEDGEDQSDVDEDEEIKKVMELMEQELKGHGALKMNKKASRSTTEKESKPVFGPERPPNMQNNAVTKKRDSTESADEDVGPGDVELSSDDEDHNDVDLGLAKNMLESFKGQAGLAGPAGNMMRAMGVNMPRDES